MIEDVRDPIQVILILIGGFCGVVLFYRGNIFSWQNLYKRDLDDDSSANHRMIFLLVLLLWFPFSYFFLNQFSILVFGLIGILALVYNQPFVLKRKIYRLKNIFLLKNLMIGFSWGLLILIGSNGDFNEISTIMFVILAIQVFIGSSVRDFYDVEVDTESGIRSVPLVLGFKNGLVLLHLMNIITLAIPILFHNLNDGILVLIAVPFWRTINLFFLNYKPSFFWTQTFNLATCYLFPIIIIVQRLL